MKTSIYRKKWRRISIRTLFFSLLLLTGMVISACADGLANEITLTPRWRDLHSRYSPLTNPAFIMSEDYKTLRGAFALSMNGAFWLTEIGGVMPLFDTAISLVGNKFQAVGITYAGEGAGNIEAYQWDALGRPVSNPTVSYSHNSFSLSYGINPWRALDVGINVDMSYQTDFGTSLFDMGMDLGAAYSIDNFPYFGRQIGKHTIALCLLNPFDIRLHDQPAYARDFRLSWLIDYVFKNYFTLQLGLQYDAKNLLFKSERNGQPKDIEQDISLRIGLTKILDILQIYCLAGSGYIGIAAGVDFNIAKPDSTRRRPGLSPVVPDTFQGQELRHNSMCADYQFMMTDSKAAPSHTFYLRNQFGKSRMQLTDNDIYIKAMKAFAKKQYWDAFNYFSKLLTLYPRFFRNNIARFYLGKSLENLRMNKVAIARYEKAKNEYNRDQGRDDDFVIPASDLGIMSIYYRDENIEGVKRQFEKLNKKDVPDSLKYHAYYLMGQATLSRGKTLLLEKDTALLMGKDSAQNKRLADKEFLQAFHWLSSIPEMHPDYPFARYSLAISYVLADSVHSVVKRHLEECTRYVPTFHRELNDDQRLIIDKAFVKLGNLHYQNKEYEEAAINLTQVQKESPLYYEAKLCQGWCAVQSATDINSNDTIWNQCINVGSGLRNKAKEILFKNEGALIEAYGLMREKKYGMALNVLKTVDTVKMDIMPQEKFQEWQKTFDQIQSGYENLAQQADEKAFLLDSIGRDKILDSLHGIQKAILDTIETRIKFKDNYKRLLCLYQDYPQTMVEIKYLYATLARKINDQGAIQQRQKENTIDNQINTLQDNLNRLNTTPNNSQKQAPAAPKVGAPVNGQIQQPLPPDTLKSEGGKDSTETHKDTGNSD